MKNFNDWKAQMRLAIQAGTIVHMVQQGYRTGAGTPTLDDLQHYSEEGGTLADLWEKSLGTEK